MRAYIAQGLVPSDPLSTFKYTTTHPVPTCPPSDTAVLVKVACASVNPADIQYVNGVYKNAPAHPLPSFPCPLGVDGSGIVTAVGGKVTKFKPGDHVLGLHQRMDEGTWAEVAAFEEAELAVKPPGICWQLAAALPVAGLTALSALLCCPALHKKYSRHSSSGIPSSAAAEAAGAASAAAAATATGVQQLQGSAQAQSGHPQLAAAAAPGTGNAPVSPSSPSPSAAAVAAASCTIGSTDPVSGSGLAQGSSEPSSHLPGFHSSTGSGNARDPNSNSSVRSVLILGASGGVGSVAVLLAKHLFRVPLVLATCSARNAKYVHNLGADAVIDYTSQDVAAAVLQHLQGQLQQQPGSNSSSGSSSARTHASTSSRSLDLVIDNVGGIDHMRMACKLLTPSSGLYVTSVPLSNPNKSTLLSVLSFFVHLSARKLLHFLAPGSYPNVAFNGASPDGHMLQGLVDGLAAAETVVHGSSAGQCVVRLTELDLQDTGVALTAVQSKRVVGKLVLKVKPEL